MAYSAGKPVPEGRRTRSTIIEHEDGDGTFWTLRDKGSADVEVWADQDGDTTTYCIRQETPDMPNADLITLSTGQAYDILLTLSAALGVPMEPPPKPWGG